MMAQRETLEASHEEAVAAIEAERGGERAAALAAKGELENVVAVKKLVTTHACAVS
jgi:hypothetical protein